MISWWLRNYATAASEYNHKNGPIEIDVDGVIDIPYRFNSFMELPSAMIRPAMWISLKE